MESIGTAEERDSVINANGRTGGGYAPLPPTSVPLSTGTDTPSTTGQVTMTSLGATSNPPPPPPLPPSINGPTTHEGDGVSFETTSSTVGEEGSDGSSFPSKLVLILKKKKLTSKDGGGDSFEKQEISKNDSYCWVCHEGGEVLCCDKCPRVFHLQCSGLAKAPDDDEEWICPVCKNISRKPKRSRPYNLKELLKLAISRMMFPGTEIFQKDIPEDIISHYREYVFHPMHLGIIKERVLSGYYNSTREFLHQTEWILHNCIIYNGGKHALTKIAKGIVKICKEDMREVELCPSCYGLTVKQPNDWFCIPCNPPHKVVLAKVRGYPLWPAKLISETSDKCDVRFFGQHDRSLVPRNCIQALNGPPPTPTTKTAHWTIAMDELSKYRNNINLMLKYIDTGKTPDEFIAEKMAEPSKPAPPAPPREPAVKIPRPPKKEKSDRLATPSQQNMSVSPTPSSSHNGYPNDRAESESRESSVAPPPTYHVSNHVPCSPQIVVVNPPLSSDESGTIHGNSASFAQSSEPSGHCSEPSSPGSDAGGLTIDLGEREEGKGKRVAPSANKSMLKGSKKVNKMGPEVFSFNSKYSAQVINPPSSYHRSSGGVASSGSNSQSRPGDALSLITHNLAEKRALELRDSSAHEGGEEDMETAFSSIYPPGKRAIAVVDPNAKRQPKRKKGAGGDVSPQKSSRKLRNKKNEIPSYSYEGTPSLITGYDTNGYASCIQRGGVMETDEVTGNSGGGGSGYVNYGEGLLANTMRTIDQSYNARLDGMVGSSSDMGYQYFSEKLMSSIKTVVIEMLSIFESKGKSGAKQIKEHLHTAWPVPDSRSQLEKLKKELKEEMEKSMEVVRTSADIERQQVIAEVKAQAEAEKELAILETKKKKWCSYCFKEAQYNCCWNANYCNDVCQQSHWPEHMSQCTQVQTPPTALAPPPRTPASALDGSGAKLLSPSQTDQSVFTFSEASSSHLQNPIEGTGGVSAPVPSLKLSYEYPIQGPPADMVATVTTVPDSQTMLSLTEDSIVSIEQLVNHAAMLVHPTSPQGFQTVMIGQPSQSRFQSTSPGHSSRLIAPPLSSSSYGIHMPPLSHHAHPNVIHQLPRPLSPSTPPINSMDPPTHSLHLAPPIAPPTHSLDGHPHSLHIAPPTHSIENPTHSLHVGNTFSWPYQQPVGSIAHDLSQGLPLMPQLPANTPTTQPNPLFRVF
ncbi:PREDICTED: protein kinase C-binding protein 1-like isoform X2 [Amphimedon queenslandica]|uniref:Protein kinase C-binding protein 1 n=1 Tax=Amphimedon queenslandica TaxID=400682 RepID=A0A1X7V300_AMPQE|nr:PREDICTED: protein kinase C-binding protein 1-like isoform X2 [Amphimedon queenslandica]|eukprot:XP_019851063.1 PREDICTED: protein kinase C-binding protein 1-like isoform X2 [Amphimedon queenslandica]